jgi:hypothetical protein
MSDDDAEKNATAIKCVISIAALVSLTVVPDGNLAMWRRKLRDALDRCTSCPKTTSALINAAHVFAHAGSGPPLQNAQARLTFETKLYFQAAAADTAERLENLMLDEVVA